MLIILANLRRLDRNHLGSRSASMTIFTQGYLSLASAYRSAFWNSFYAWPGLALMQLYHRFTRLIYEYLLHDDRLPFPSILSPHLPYSHPNAGVWIYSRPTSANDGYFDVQVGDITYVMQNEFSMCPWTSMIESHSLIFTAYQLISRQFQMDGLVPAVTPGRFGVTVYRLSLFTMYGRYSSLEL